MKTHVFLKMASVVAMLYCAGHTSGYPWTPGEGTEALSVIQAMKSNSFDTDGIMRTYWDFYLGFGLIISGFLLLKGVALWQMSSMSKHNLLLVKPLLATFFALYLVNAFFAWKYFFPLPAILALVTCVLIAVAFFIPGRRA